MKRTLILTGIFLAALLVILKSSSVNAAIDISLFQDWYFEGGQEGADMGFSVSTAGDVNGDGYADVIVGSPLFTPPEPESIEQEGGAFVFYGSENGLQTEPDWMVGSGKQGSHFGCSVSSAGDVNGDGYDDVIVGAEYYKVAFEGVTGEPQSGAAFLYLGSADGLSETASWMKLAEKRNISFGFSVAPAGDINNDGYADVIIGAPNFGSSIEQSSEGKAYIYLGSETGLEQAPVWSYECNLSTSKCGHAVSSAGDVNNDGFADIIIGAPYYDQPLTNEGAAFLFLGSAQGFGGAADQIINSGQEGALLGESVASAGDVNGDGYGDLILGAPKFDQDIDRPNFGAAFIYLGSPTGVSPNSNWVAYGPEENSWFGKSVGVAGDINQDGFSDVIVGAYLFGQNGEENQPDEGAVYLYAGSSFGVQSTYGWATFGDKAETEFGRSTGTAGDINGDGKDDIIIGAPKYKFDEKTVMGRAFIYLNASSPGGTTNYKVFIPSVVKPE